MKYGKLILASIGIYLFFYFVKIFVVNSLFDQFSVTGPIVKLCLDVLWLVATVYVWRRLKNDSTTDVNETDIADKQNDEHKKDL